MKTLSYWAKAHPKKAKISIAILQIFLLLLTVLSATLLSTFNLYFSKLAIGIPFIILCIISLLYPLKSVKRGIFKFKYFKTKLYDGIITCCIILIAVLSLNNTINQDIINNKKHFYAKKIILKKHQNQTNSLQKSLFNKFKKKSKNFKKRIKKKLLKLKKRLQKKNTSTIILYSFLLLLGLAATAWFLVGFYCSISCGYGLLISLFYALGTGLSIYLFVYSLRKIVEASKKPKQGAVQGKTIG